MPQTPNPPPATVSAGSERCRQYAEAQSAAAGKAAAATQPGASPLIGGGLGGALTAGGQDSAEARQQRYNQAFNSCVAGQAPLR